MPVSPSPDTTGLLLAAGASRRFGSANKLLAPFRGRPLVSYAADALRCAGLNRLIAVISDPELAPLLGGFDLIHIPQGEQSDSLRAGVAAAGQPSRLLVVLGDMPLVSPALLKAVVSSCTDDTPAASCDGDGPAMPPSCFPAKWLPRLAALSGDQGAGRLLRQLPEAQIIEAAGELSDIDTAEALRDLQA